MNTTEYALVQGARPFVPAIERRPADVKLVSDVMEAPLWLCPDHTVRMALAIMKGLSVELVAIVEGGAYLGTVDWKDLITAPPDEPLLRVMRKDAPYLSPDASVREAAEMLTNQKLSRVPVVRNDALVGLLGAVNLLNEVGRSEDPLTGLPWSDSLREWALARFRSGKELSILFFDLDNFGQFNKRFGHLVGDHVLQEVAGALREGVDPHMDFLCRYGGDEFTIATMRRSEAANALAADLAHAVACLRPSGSEEPITVSWGAFGGQRDREREDVHYAATLDALINQASKNCQKMKDRKKEEAQVAPSAQAVVAVDVGDVGPITLRSLSVVAGDGDSVASVELRVGESLFSATLSGPPDRASTLKTVAQAVADAISHALPNDCTMVVHDCQVSSEVDGSEFVRVKSTLYTADAMRELTGSHSVEGDPQRAVALATIASAQAEVLSAVERGSLRENGPSPVT